MRKFRALVASVATGCDARSAAARVRARSARSTSIPTRSKRTSPSWSATPLKGKATAAADLEPLRAMLPPEVALSWGNLTFDAATGSTLITDLKLTPKDMPTVGVQVAELRLWDFDAKLLQDRVSRPAPDGNRIARPPHRRQGRVAVRPRRRDERAIPELRASRFRGLRFPGTGRADRRHQPRQVPATHGSDDAGADRADADEPFDDMFDASTPMMSIERYDVSIGRIVLDDVMLKPYQVTPAPPAADGMAEYDPMAMLMPVLQQFAAIAQSYGIDTAAYFDFKVGMDDDRSSARRWPATSSIAAMGARGMRGGDLDGMFIRDINYAASIADVGTGAPVRHAVHARQHDARGHAPRQSARLPRQGRRCRRAPRPT